MSTQTLFTYIKGVVSNGDDTVPEASSSFVYPPLASVQNVSQYRRETLTLDATDTRTVTLANYASTDWVVFMARVIGTDGAVGEVKLTTVGVDWDGVTAIEGVTGGYGTDRHPGFISLVSTKVTSFTLTGIADGTQVEYLIGKLLADDQL